MLPAYICRTLAERELVLEVVEENRETDGLEAAFDTHSKSVSCQRYSSSSKGFVSY